MTESNETTHSEGDVSVMMASVAASLVASNYPAPQADEVLRRLAQRYNTPTAVELLPTMVLSQSVTDGYSQFQKININLRFDQIVAAQNVIAQAQHNAPPPADVTEALEAVRHMKPRFPHWLRVLGYALSSLGFAACFQMDPYALLVAAVMGALVGTLVLWASRRANLAALMPFIATLLTGLTVAGLALITGSPDPVRLVAMPVVVLLPGAVLTSGLIELVSGYMVSGVSRLGYAIMILGTMAFGFAVAIQLSGLPGNRLEDVTAQLTPSWVSWVGAAIFAVGTFLYFCTPLHLWMPSLAVIMVSWSIAVTVPSGMGAALAAGVATFAGLVLAWVFNARLGGGPGALVLFLPTFWLIVPGSALFVVFTGSIESVSALTALGGQAALSFLAMAIGMMAASALLPSISRITPDLSDALKRGLSFLPVRR